MSSPRKRGPIIPVPKIGLGDYGSRLALGFASLGRDDTCAASIVPASRRPRGVAKSRPRKFRGRAGCRERQKRNTALCTKGGKCRGELAASETGEPASRARLVFGVPSPDPRRTYQAILRWMPSRFRRPTRWHAPARNRHRKAEVASGRLAGPRRLQPPQSSRCVARALRPTAFPLRASSALETPLGEERD
jgi:hypothetical protein